VPGEDRVVERARIVLSHADGASVSGIAATLSIDVVVSRRTRFSCVMPAV
jgi:hypothetical protein